MSTRTTPSGIGPIDLHLFNEGTHSRLYERLGAHPWSRTAAPAPRSACGRRTPRPCRSSATSTAGTSGRTRCSRASRPASGTASCPTSGRARSTSTTSARATRGYRVDKADPFAFRAEEPPRTGSVVADLDYEWGDAEWMASRGAAHRARRADLDLRGAPRLVAALARRGEPRARLPRARARCWPTTRRGSASRTSSCCRSWSTRSTARGATRRPATSRRPAATARRRTSCT